MVQLQEITSEMAEKLKVSQSQPEEKSDPTPNNAEEAVLPELPPARAEERKKTVDEVYAELKKTPFFMTELEENDDTEAFKALDYEGTPDEIGVDFKDRGNGQFKIKKWADAKEFYTKGVLVLAAEERKRTKGTPTESESPEDVKSQRATLEALYVNRAACHLELKNYRSCTLDCAAALRLNPQNIKAYYRSSRSLLAVDRIEDADGACSRGLELDANNESLKAVAQDIIKRSKQVTAKQKKEAERVAKEKRRAYLLKAALKARGIKTRTTPQPPEMGDVELQLVPDPDDPTSSLSFPAVFLYPVDLQSDFIKAFNETETMEDHLGYIFPLPWDQQGVYNTKGVECFMETLSGGLVKVGKKVRLLKVLVGNVEVVDDMVKIYIVPKAKSDDWVKDFKAKKAMETGKSS